MPYATQEPGKTELNRLYAEDLPVHEWYRFVLSYPPHLVRDYLQRFGMTPEGRVLDPFCGTGTTLVEAKKCGIPSVGLEANPVAHYAASTKSTWSVAPQELYEHAQAVALETLSHIDDAPYEGLPLFAEDRHEVLRHLPPDLEKLLITNSISPRPLHKALTLLDAIETLRDDRFYDFERVAFAKQLVYTFSNLRFGPEVGLGKRKGDSAVVGPWLAGVHAMVDDLTVQVNREVPAVVHLADARQIAEVLEPQSVDAVITSPPYPNEKDYSRTTRLESVLLGFIRNKEELRRHKQNMLVSNTRNVYKGDDAERYVAHNPRIQALAAAIEAKRLELEKTSGFERLYARVVKLYFGGLARHLELLKPKLRPGARLVYVVGDQASYFRILIRTGELLAEVARDQGYTVEGIDLFRHRFSTPTGQQLREEAVVLRWEP